MIRLKGSNEDSITVACCSLQPMGTHTIRNTHTVTRFPTHTSYNAHTSLTQTEFECPQHTDKQTHTHTHTHSTTKSFENPEGAISKSAKEKRMIIPLRVNLGAFCDYGYLFGAARYSLRQNERKYRSLLGYENTCRHQIISCHQSPQHPFSGTISTSLTLLPHPHFTSRLYTAFSSFKLKTQSKRLCDKRLLPLNEVWHYIH